MRPTFIEPLEARIAPATVSISPVSTTVDEGDDSTPNNIVEFHVNLDAASDSPVMVKYALRDGTAFVGQQYNPVSGQPVSDTLTFAPGETSKTIDVAVVGNSTVNPDTTFSVALSEPSGASIAANAGVATVKILDDDHFINFTAASLHQSKLEGDSGVSNLTFTPTLDSAADHDITVTYQTVDGVGTGSGYGYATSSGAAADYGAVSGTLVFKAGSLTPVTPSFNVAINGDALPGPDEVFTVQLVKSGPGAVGAKFGPDSSTTVTILNDEATTSDPNLKVALVGDPSTTEGGTAQFTFQLSGLSESPVTVNFHTVDGTAMAGADYIGKTGPIQIISATSTTVGVPILSDHVAESAENFHLTLDGATVNGAAIGLGTKTSSTATIAADPLLDFKVGNVSLHEGNDGISTAVFTAVLGQPVPAGYSLVVDYATADGTAHAGEDYNSATGSLTIPAGSKTGTVSVGVLGDHVLEPNETFTLNFSNAHLVSSTDSTSLAFAGVDSQHVVATGTIVNDEPLGVTATLTADAATVLEHPSAGTPAATFTVKLSSVSSSDVTVHYSYVEVHNDLTKSTVTDSIVIRAFTDTGTITVGYAQAATVNHDQSITVTLNSLEAANAPAGSSFRPLASAKTAKTVVYEDDVYAEILPSLKAEGNSGTSPMPFQVKLVDAAGALVKVDHPVSVGFGTVNGTGVTAAVGTGAGVAHPDYVSTGSNGGAILFRSGENAGTINVPIIGDTLPGANEVFVVGLGLPNHNTTGIKLLPGHESAYGTIVNDDGAAAKPVLTVSAGPAVAEGQPVVFTVKLDKAYDSPVTFDYATAIGATDTADASDFTPQATTSFTIPGGQTTATIQVATTVDLTPEDAETFSLVVSNVQGAANDPSATVTTTGTIQYSNEPTLSIDNVSAYEGATGETKQLTFTISAKDANGNPVLSTAEAPITFNLDTATGAVNPATEGTDFNGVHLTQVQIPAGQSSLTQTVTINGDNTGGEGDETFILRASQVHHAGPASVEGVGTILNDDTTFTLSGPAGAVSEGAGTASFTVTRSGDTAGTSVVTYNTVPGTGPGAATSSGASPDFQAQAGTVTFGPNEVTKTIPINIFDDNHHEGSETFSVVLSAPKNGMITGTGTATATIADNDLVPTVTLSSPAAVHEGDSGTTPATFTVTLNHVNDEADVVFKYSTAGGTATAGQDYTGATDVAFTIPKGQLSGTFAVPVINDLTFDSAPTETFGVTLTLNTPDAAHPAATFAGGATVLHGTGSIIDNEVAPQISIASASFVEGAPATLVATLNHPSDKQVTAKYFTVDGTAKSVGTAPDYTGKTQAAPGTITFAPGSTSATLSGLSTVDDNLVEGSETFRVQLTAPVGAALSKTAATATATILDNDAAYLSINNVSIVEGNSGAKDAVFTVSLVGDTAAPVTVDYATAAALATATTGVATAGSDYAPASGTLTLGGANGPHTAQVTVKIFGDLSSENANPALRDENFNVVLSNAKVATIVQGTGVGTIVNDGDTMPSLSINSVAGVEGDTADTKLHFTATLSSAAPTAVTFNVATSELVQAANVARLGSDFLANTATFTIPQGALSASFDITVKADTVFEPTEFFKVNLTHVTGAVADAAPGYGTIYDNDLYLAPTVAKWTDVDGDLVTMTTTKGSLSNVLPISTTFQTGAGNMGGRILQYLDLVRFAGNTFAHGNISITAVQQPAAVGASTGDGKVDVGYIRANNYDTSSGDPFGVTGIDLGVVTIDGDLSRINVGDLFSNASVAQLNVGSIGVHSAVTDPQATTSGVAAPALSNLLAGATSIKVAGDIQGAVVALGGVDGKIGNLQVGGALRGTAGDNSGRVLLTGALGKATIHDIVGGAGLASGSLTLYGSTASTAGSIAITGDVTGGDGDLSGSIQFQSIGTLSIGGNLTGKTTATTSADANGQSVTTTHRGGIISASNSLGPITIGGNVTGGAAILGAGLTNNVAVKSVIVHGSVNDAQILGGFLLGGTAADGTSQFDTAQNADAQIGYVQVDGSVAKFDVLAGVQFYTKTIGVTDATGQPVIDPSTQQQKTVSASGYTTEGFNKNDSTLFSRIATVVFNGSIVANPESHFIMAEGIGSVLVDGESRPASAAGTEVAPGTNFFVKYAPEFLAPPVNPGA